MSRDSSVITHRIIRCPICQKRMLDISSGKQPFKPSTIGVALEICCQRCGKKIEIQLENK